MTTSLPAPVVLSQIEPFPPSPQVRPCIGVGVDEGGHHGGHLEAHADVGEYEAPGQGDALHRDVEAGEGEQDEDQAEVHIVEWVLESAQAARLLDHPQPHLTIVHDLVPYKGSFAKHRHRRNVTSHHSFSLL